MLNITWMCAFVGRGTLNPFVQGLLAILYFCPIASDATVSPVGDGDAVSALCLDVCVGVFSGASPHGWGEDCYCVAHFLRLTERSPPSLTSHWSCLCSVQPSDIGTNWIQRFAPWCDVQ